MKYLNVQVRLNKMENELSVTFHLSLSELNLMDTPSNISVEP